MSSLKFVNINGDPVSTFAPPQFRSKSPALKRTADPEKAKAHFGFEVVGVPASALESAKAHAKFLKKDFDPVAWENAQKPKRVIKRVYSIPEAAQIAADILLRTGQWLKVSVQPILKG